MKNVRGSATTALLVAALGGGCADQPAPAAWTTVTDTVGGVIRVTHTPGTDAGPTLVADEELRVGTIAGEGPESFGLIRSIAVPDDGRFAVADAQDEEVRPFDPGGQHLRTFGGAGQGPGELLGMQGVFLDHEGMLRVAEQQNARLSVFHPDTGFVRSFPVRLNSCGFRGPWTAAIDSTPAGRGADRRVLDHSGRRDAARGGPLDAAWRHLVDHSAPPSARAGDLSRARLRDG